MPEGTWQRHVRLRREAMLDTAIDLIRRRGPEVTVEALAAELGVTRPVLYRYFRDRAALSIAIAERLGEDLLRRLSRPGGRTRGRESLRLTLSAYLAFVEGDPNLYRFLSRDLTGEGASEVLHRVAKLIAATLAAGLREAGRDAAGAEPLAHGLVGMVHQVADWWVSTGCAMNRRSLVEHLTSLAWDGLAGAGISLRELVP